MEKGVGKDLIINILLTIFGYIPGNIIEKYRKGIIHAFYVILRY
ncbi:hypothetical protein O9G_004532 [Rozella allomycis CSF55]|nr:hypothetical protein O9G_004532 [Rozella allomycis CSF55]|eukprot:EPZ34766.1 hypothetical protein O9G_004532 [Rozella allomycis CSF55]